MGDKLTVQRGSTPLCVMFRKSNSGEEFISNGREQIFMFFGNGVIESTIWHFDSMAVAQRLSSCWRFESMAYQALVVPAVGYDKYCVAGK